MLPFIMLSLSLVAGSAFFALGQELWTLAGLGGITLATRFVRRTSDFGRFAEMLLLFFLVSTAINRLGIHYPESLIIILAMLVGLIFYEGPEWGKLFFSPGDTRHFFKTSLLLAGGLLVVQGGYLFFFRGAVENPIPQGWPADVLIVLGLGFAFYIAIVEEIVFRSFLYQRAATAAGADAGLWTQALLYGLMTYRDGVPNGAAGFVIGSLFGLGTGYLVKKSQSVYLSMLVHLIVSLGVYVELVTLSR